MKWIEGLREEGEGGKEGKNGNAVPIRSQGGEARKMTKLKLEWASMALPLSPASSRSTVQTALVGLLLAPILWCNIGMQSIA